GHLRGGEGRGSAAGADEEAEPPADDEADGEDRRIGPNSASAMMLAALLREELWRDDHPNLVRLGDAERPLWWLREPDLAEQPLADRVEWATFTILSTAGRLDE